jgi:hypothetical protein
MSRADLTEIVCVIDESGSMDRIRQDAIGGFNSFLRNQQEEEGEALFSLTLFDTDYERIYDGVELEEVPELDEQSYQPGGRTALLDAVGRTILDVRNRLNETDESEKPGQVVFVILTDGKENSSQEFIGEQVPEMIAEQRQEANWEFVFLAADANAFQVARDYNISPSNVDQFEGTGEDINRTYHSASNAVTSIRRTGSIESDWRETSPPEDEEDEESDA